MQELVRIGIKKVVGPTQLGTAVLLGNEEKTFVMYIGPSEGMALLRELNGEPPVRPLTHELMMFIMNGFDIEVKKVVINEIVDSTFCAVLILEQTFIIHSEGGTEERTEVRMDARPSDCLVLALKNNVEIWCSRQVLANVRDITDQLQDINLGAVQEKMDELSKDWTDINFDLPNLDLDEFGEFDDTDEVDPPI